MYICTYTYAHRCPPDLPGHACVCTYTHAWMHICTCEHSYTCTWAHTKSFPGPGSNSFSTWDSDRLLCPARLGSGTCQTDAGPHLRPRKGPWVPQTATTHGPRCPNFPSPHPNPNTTFLLQRNEVPPAPEYWPGAPQTLSHPVPASPRRSSQCRPRGRPSVSSPRGSSQWPPDP